ncbi:HNH endonuclease [Bdellovibrio sp. HCB-162]|uniref:HNH endonuclease n=1 Tax=Bdellovibrio sp. HCB-162 TaxID=3394234 RepID=UPI0039BD80C4
MSLQNIGNSELVARLEKLVRTERKITHVILLHILEIEDRKIYAELGIAEKLESGALNLTQLTQVQKCIKGEMRTSGTIISQSQTQKILQEIENKNTFETQKVLAAEFNQPIQTIETVKPQADETVRLEITLSKEEFEELKKAKELLSHICIDGSWSDVISTLAKKFNNSKLGNKISNPTKITSVLTPTSTHSFSIAKDQRCKRPNRRKYMSVQIKRKLLKNARYCCEYVNPETGAKCSSKYQLQIDHIHPWSLGGSDEIGNLRVLCRTHNIFAADVSGVNSKFKKWSGIQVSNG